MNSFFGTSDFLKLKKSVVISVDFLKLKKSKIATVDNNQNRVIFFRKSDMDAPKILDFFLSDQNPDDKYTRVFSLFLHRESR